MALCAKILDDEDKRREALERKAGALLVLSLTLITSVASLLAYILARPSWSTATIVASGAAAVLFLVSFVASFRALAVTAYERLDLRAILDPDTRQFRRQPADELALGQLWCAAMNGAANDHVANFVRASRSCLLAGAFVLLPGGMLALSWSDGTTGPAGTTATSTQESWRQDAADAIIILKLAREIRALTDAERTACVGTQVDGSAVLPAHRLDKKPSHLGDIPPQKPQGPERQPRKVPP